MTSATLQSFAPSVLLAVLLACSSFQVLHGFLRIMHSNPRVRRLVAVYESALLVHIVLMALMTLASLPLEKSLFSSIVAFPTPFGVALWANAAVAAVTAYTALSRLDDTGEPESADWMPAVETVVVFCCTPIMLSFFGNYRFLALAGDALYFLVRSCYLLFLDRKNRRKVVSPLSIAEALRRLPEGLLYANKSGRVIFENDVMRRCLSDLGISGDRARPFELWDSLEHKSHNGHGVNVPPEMSQRPGAWIILRIGPDEVRLFSFEGIGFDGTQRYQSTLPPDTEPPRSEMVREVLGETPFLRIIAYDVTDELQILEEIEQTNIELEATQAELRASMATVREAAENEAMLRMRGRVHDVIGQRLSMLHRSLEDNAISDEQLERLKPLLNGILDDLAADNQVQPADELTATVNSFALIGVDIDINGSLPADEHHAKLFADCIRESATNAVKHAVARHVRVSMTEHTLVVANDGQQPIGPIQEGTGLTNMRHAVEGEGGTLEITTQPFALSITLPHESILAE